MALDKAQLAKDLVKAFKTAQAESKKDGESDEQFMARITQEIADLISDAVDSYVRGGEVTGVTVTVTDPANVVIGTGTQTGAVKLK